MRAALAVIVIGLLALSPLAVQASASSTSSSLKLSLSPTSGTIGSTVNVNGSLMIHGSTSAKPYNLTIFFGNLTQPIATIQNVANGSEFKTSFYVPLVDSGPYLVNVTDGKGTSRTQVFYVSYGIDTLIENLTSLDKKVSVLGQEVNQSQVASVLTGITSQLNSLVSENQQNTNQQNAINQQLSTINQTMSSLERLVSNSNSNVQSLYPLLILFVALEGVVVGLVFVLIILTLRRRGPRGRLDEVEIIES